MAAANQTAGMLISTVKNQASASCSKGEIHSSMQHSRTGHEESAEEDGGREADEGPKEVDARAVNEALRSKTKKKG